MEESNKEQSTSVASLLDCVTFADLGLNPA